MDTQRLAAGVGAAIAAALDEDRIIGTVVAVLFDGQMVLLEAAGLADREAERPITADAIFLLASCTKPVATATALRLAEDGLVDLDAPVIDHLPDFRPHLPDGEAPAITLRHLLTHTSGLSYPFREAPGGPYHRANVSSGLDQPGLSGAEQLARLASVPLLFRPGERWEYSLGVDVAGLMLEAAAGQPLDVLVKSRITDPLGLVDTGFAVTDRSRLVAHYGTSDDGLLERMTGTFWRPTLQSPAAAAPERIFDRSSYLSGGAGMAGTAAELVRVIDALRAGGHPLLSSDSTRLMVTDAVPHLPDVMDIGWSYGLGTHVLRDAILAGGPERSGAFRGSGGYGHIWFADPALGLSVVALTNSAPEGIRGRYTRELRQAVYAAFD
ncbi:CubicO group peptidase, beta-lactamase class C family [Devosia enhydra]|uniref:CubicO group peptidase, beta-lactamase class C family n=1 Tax=Devosia enhydra TaxID=665118 RepID=A0A1K2HT60_9HYPH|nr:serine hydrolase domain-containing protein [Devosia enhydra]SFZ81251.1 CubicO group peptidase, beta-lactamase class C family [Devosia enhydra]